MKLANYALTFSSDERFFFTNKQGVKPRFVISDARAYFNVCILKEPVFAQIHSKLNSGNDLQINFVNRFIKTFTVHSGVMEAFLDISTKVSSYEYLFSVNITLY